MRRILLATVFLCLPSTLAFAQSETWQSTTQAAVEETDFVQKRIFFEQALELASTSEEKFDSYLNFSYMFTNQGVHSEAAIYAGKALTLADKELSDDSNRRTLAVVQKSQSLRKTGRISEANTLINDDVARKSKVGDHIWQPIENGIMHKFSQMRCPDFVANMPRQEFHNFSQAGIDVGCTYELISEYSNAVTLYFSKSSKMSDLDAIKRGGAAFFNRLPDAQKIAVEKRTNFQTGSGNPVYYSQVGFGNIQGGERYTGAWTQVVGDWILKTRVTWDSELGVSFGTEKSKALFTANSKIINEHMNMCQTKNDTTSGEHLQDSEKSTAIIMEELVIAISPLIKKGKDHLIVTAPTIPKSVCFALKSNDDKLALGYHPEENRRYSSYSAIFDTQYFVMKSMSMVGRNDTNSERFTLQTVKNNKLLLLQVYEGEPNPNIVFQDIANNINNETSIMGSITMKKSGGSDIYINADYFKTEKEKE